MEQMGPTCEQIRRPATCDMKLIPFQWSVAVSVAKLLKPARTLLYLVLFCMVLTGKTVAACCFHPAGDMAVYCAANKVRH